MRSKVLRQPYLVQPFTNQTALQQKELPKPSPTPTPKSTLKRPIAKASIAVIDVLHLHVPGLVEHLQLLSQAGQHITIVRNPLLSQTKVYLSHLHLERCATSKCYM